MPFNKLNHSVLGEIRPRFRLKSSLSIEAIKAVLDEQMKKDETVVGNVQMDYAIIRIPAAEQHYWTPELQVHLEQEENSEDTLLRCLVGPKQTVWALFLFVYISIAALTFFLGMYGLIQMQLGKESDLVYVIPIGLLLLPSIYTFSKIGQKTGRDQMMHLISFLYHTLDREGRVERTEI